ncbi:MAG TPA: hypothetical protein ACFYD9_12155 [Candidatus Wunengus sp. YC64]|uniref:hypothetical protein n=1 Tax=Candidatus Wunengus sp. YC64 TaxID=3367700 RepID=UPI0027138634|nr:hypothetical protein [Candidatus Brocadiales bacterium]
MAISTCPKCDNILFEVVENSPVNSDFKYLFIQCNSCGAVVGTMDYYNIGEILTEIQQRLDMIQH